jgi:hypothetical protein
MRARLLTSVGEGEQMPTRSKWGRAGCVRARMLSDGIGKRNNASSYIGGGTAPCRLKIWRRRMAASDRVRRRDVSFQ